MTQRLAPSELSALLKLATRLASEAGAYLLDGVHRPRTSVETKSTASDMVSEMDRGAERMIVDGILRERPDDGLLGEEGAERAGTSGLRWVIDPLDGTTNYLYGNPMWSVSIAVEREGVGIVGVVEAPTLRETFAAATGAGATRNGTPIRVTDCDSLDAALVATGFSYDPDARRLQGLVAARLLPIVRDLRRAGSAALDLCAVASGRVDAYYERGCKAWDLAAGAVILREAGGIATDLENEPPSTSMCVAANPRLHALLQSELRAGSSHHAG